MTEPVVVCLILLALIRLVTSVNLRLFTGSTFEPPGWSFEPLSWSFTMNTDLLCIPDSLSGVVLVMWNVFIIFSVGWFELEFKTLG